VFTRHTGVLLTSLLSLLVGCGKAAVNSPVVELSATGDTVLTSYGDITEAAWLGGARWAVVSPGDDAVGLIDFTARRVNPLGPKQFRHPSTVFVVADTLYVGDWGLRLLTLWTLRGNRLRSIPAANIVRGTLPRARDRAGRFYLDEYPPAGPDGSGNRDSAAVVRLDAGFTRLDTIARLAPLDIAEVTGDAGRRFERRVFSGQDRWGILADGSLWLARVYSNRVDWRSPDGKWLKGQSLPDRILEVTRYDRELFLRKFPPELRATAQELPFAALKPPFESGLTQDPDRVWLEKSRAPADSARRYHVVGRQGKLLGEIRLRGQGRILAFGGDRALVAEPSPQGVRLIAVRLPAGAGP
jgi:hypothetical protein